MQNQAHTLILIKNKEKDPINDINGEETVGTS